MALQGPGGRGALAAKRLQASEAEFRLGRARRRFVPDGRRRQASAAGMPDRALPASRSTHTGIAWSGPGGESHTARGPHSIGVKRASNHRCRRRMVILQKGVQSESRGPARDYRPWQGLSSGPGAPGSRGDLGCQGGLSGGASSVGARLPSHAATRPLGSRTHGRFRSRHGRRRVGARPPPGHTRLPLSPLSAGNSTLAPCTSDQCSDRSLLQP